MNKLTLSDGRQIPCLGYGCYNAFGEELINAVTLALEAGYTYIDSAEIYGNEDAVGTALGRRTDRENLYILSKAWPGSYENVEAACVGSLRNLQTDYLDAYLLHWPGNYESRRLSAYEQLLKLKDKGLILTFGVSNFLPDQLEKLKEEFGAYPVINEIECHPSFHQKELIDWCRARGIQVISYEPICRQADLSLPAVLQLAEKYSRTPAQIVLRWHVQHDQIPIPKSSNAGRLRENISVFDFELEEEDMKMIDRCDTGVRAGQDPFAFPAGF